MLRLLLLAAAALVAASCANSASAPASSGCPHGAIWDHKVNGIETYDYCGPARATAVFAGKTMTFKNGSCTRTSDRFVVNIGRVGVHKRQPPHTKYFSVGIVNPRNGRNTHNGLLIGVQFGHDSYFVGASSMNLSSHMTRGSFVGRLSSPLGNLRYEGTRISAKFSCNGGV